jgi:hypothetical protein
VFHTNPPLGIDLQVFHTNPPLGIELQVFHTNLNNIPVILLL